MSTPEITVLMPVYNGEKFLKKAMESILHQTFTDFEFLIINDGSTDNSTEIIRSFQDKRIRLIQNGQNLGLIKTLNKGIDLSEGKFIARMDADDVSVSERLEKQYRFLMENREIGAVGSWFRMIHSGGAIKHPVNQEDIKIALLQYCPLGHPTVMFRKDVFLQHDLKYDENYIHAEDYELWVRCVDLFPLANIPEVLLHYRDHPEQVGQKYKQEQKMITDKIRKNQVLKMGINISKEELQFHLRLLNGENNKDYDFILSATQWLEKLQKQNQVANIYKEDNFSRFLSNTWMLLIFTSTSFSKKLLNLYKDSPLLSYCKVSRWNTLKFYIKCYIGKN